MKEFKGTKGDWKIEIKELERCCISSENRGLFIDAWGVGIGGVETFEEVEANAKLIAAAPELLEALQKIKSDIIENQLDGYFDCIGIENAIEKALN